MQNITKMLDKVVGGMNVLYKDAGKEERSAVLQKIRNARKEIYNKYDGLLFDFDPAKSLVFQKTLDEMNTKDITLEFLITNYESMLIFFSGREMRVNE